MWASFREKYVCTAEIISFSIAIIAGFFIWLLFHNSVYALLLAIFGGGAIYSVLIGEETIIWPKSIEQRIKEESEFYPECIKKKR